MHPTVQNINWLGGNSNLIDTTNWSTGNNPTQVDTAVFNWDVGLKTITIGTSALPNTSIAQLYAFNGSPDTTPITWTVDGPGILQVGKSSGGSTASRTGLIASDGYASATALGTILLNAQVKYVDTAGGTLAVGNTGSLAAVPGHIELTTTA